VGELTSADTAFSIAAVRAEEQALPAGERLFDDPHAHLFAAAGTHAAEATARYLGLPMFREGIRLRTRFIDDAVREGIADGARQLVLLGAGFDTRGLRLAEVDQTAARVFEIDVPGQLERKAACLVAAGIPLAERVALVPFDFDAHAGDGFEAALLGALAARGFVAGAATIFVWEGVLGYIDDPAIERSLRFMSQAGGAGSRLVFTAHDGAFAPESAPERMRRHGFAVCEEIGVDVAWRRWLPTEPHPYSVMSRLGVARR
jgi:methyltransferase (TIGR00027 family)